MSYADEAELNAILTNPERSIPATFAVLISPNIGLLVENGCDEFVLWRQRLVQKRNDEAHIFILYLLPTIQCQFECVYCFEKGGVKLGGMSDEVISRTAAWLENYLQKHGEIDSLRVVLFGGEPLIRKDVVRNSLEVIHALADKRELDFWTEITSNGELLDEEMARILAKHNWRRAQITIDGPEDVHNVRRPGKHGRPTFQNVIRAVRMLASTDHIDKVDIRISLDHSNAERVPELIRYLADFGLQDRMNLSLGLITPTLDRPVRMQQEDEQVLGEKAVSIWAFAQKCGFSIPQEFITGPWCVAIAKHSAVLQPNGAFQKCFCTVGRSEFDFGTVSENPVEYLQDPRFEKWCRTDDCISEQCPFLPMCGGGCIHDAIVANGSPDGGAKRFCQKSLLRVYNEGLLKLNYIKSIK